MAWKTGLDVGADGVAIVAINNPPLNLLSVTVMLDLKRTIEGALLRDDVKAIVVTGLKGKFSAGFDVTTFGGRQGKRTKKELGFMSIEIVTDTLEGAKKPLVAAIDGPAFGGGLEIALACHARISTSTAQLGLTELQYGILPGLGGTQRLPRLVGLTKALEMILMSKRVSGEEARTLTLVDAIAPADKLLGVARQWALDIAECRRPWIVSLYKIDRLEPFVEARAILKSARLEVQRQNPNLVHQLVCIDVIEHGIVSGPRNALWKEAEALQELRQSSTCKSLVHVFFAQRQVSKVPGVTERKFLPRKFNKVALIGGGSMSSEVAKLLVLNNYQVILKEKDEKSLLEQINRVKRKLQSHAKNQKADQYRPQKFFSLVKGVLDYDDFKDVELVIEAEAETLSLNLEKICPPHCIFTSNSLTFNSKSFGEKTNCHDRIAGIHFFCQSPNLPLMEIVRMKNTSPQVIIDLMDFGRKLRKTPIVVGDLEGRSFNSLLIKYLHAAIFLAEEGVDVYLIDKAFTNFGMLLGPFRMIDMLGLQVFEAIGKMYVETFPDSSYRSKLISILRHCDNEGESNAQGFYRYDNCGMATPNPEINKYLQKAENTSYMAIEPELTKLSNDEMVEMILFPALNEACQLISKGIVIRPSDLDVASVLGMGFPAYRGGIVYWSDTFGSPYVHSNLENWSKVHGEFFKPCAYITECAAKRVSLVVHLYFFFV
ncbi:glyoxysomal fatty acid beta-oxidation multifunctional protein MFP-a-like [Dorcoceras hygrometricum]|uniref:Glyoxysomal fatty acid beta-oxidation multifunctional protein MFP-a-like n=1 Tax=Dorcoceras hygrometricum TaxID=472368 RepID=A0A2Z7AJL7_9LAMI|nr:glyoxysomal fatty acid beta-oxidation multifunctional protein MFP-a-like [Dorcoceras hygrometricum]